MEDVDLIAHLDSVDLTKVDRSQPVFKPTSVSVTITKMEVLPTKPTEKNPTGGHRLSIHLALNEKAETVDGKWVEPNPAKPVIFDSVSLKQTEKFNPLERLADIQLATYGAQRQGFKPADYVGQTAVVKLKSEDSDDYGLQTRVVRWVPKKQVTGTSLGASAPGSL